VFASVSVFILAQSDDYRAMKLLDNTPLLKIEDILPFFPDFVVIDDFKEEICTALEGYSAHIDQLKVEMDEATRSAESIKNDIKELKNRFITIEQNEKCSTCSYPLLTRQFYVFPCQHTFHADCLIGQVTQLHLCCLASASSTPLLG
jgi:vacuolar protein sorting-associated protein 18